MTRGVTDWVMDKMVIKHRLTTVGLITRDFYVINDYVLAKELFGKEQFSGRSMTQFLLEQKSGDGKRYGIISTEGIHWSNQRRFGLRKLKDFGFGKKSLEESINIEIDETVKKLLHTDGKDFYLGADFNIPIINILWQLVAGTRFHEENYEDDKMIGSVNKLVKSHMKMNLIPLNILKMYPKLTEYEDNVEIYRIVKKFIAKQITEHETNLDTEYPRDFIDSYLIEMNIKEEDNKLTKKDLENCMFDFILAGTETSSTTLKWIVLYLTLYQEVQDKCREDILHVLGTSTCTVADMARLPYVQATISEIQRLSSVAPLSITHRTLSATTVDGFTFPEGSVFVANLTCIMQDQDNFPQPHLFNPKRFIGDSGKFVKTSKFVPFGVGKRLCMGEVLARNEVFLFTVSLVQKLQFLPPLHHPPPHPGQYCAGLTNIPQDFHLKIVPVSSVSL